MVDRLGEQDKKIETLPEKVVEYLGAGRVAHDGSLPDMTRRQWRITQSRLLNEMTNFELDALCDYVSWQYEQIKQRMVQQIGRNRLPAPPVRSVSVRMSLMEGIKNEF